MWRLIRNFGQRRMEVATWSVFALVGLSLQEPVAQDPAIRLLLSRTGLFLVLVALVIINLSYLSVYSKLAGLEREVEGADAPAEAD